LKKRREAGRPKVISKRQKIIPASAAASAAAADEEVAENVAMGSASGVRVEGEHFATSLDLGSDDFIQDAFQGMGAGSAVDPSIVAPMPGVFGDDSFDSEGEDIGGGSGACSPSDAKVGSTSHR
jgi:hypothetical protein